MWKKAVALSLLTVFMFMVTTDINAISTESKELPPISEYGTTLFTQFTNHTTTTLTLPSGQASATARFVGYAGITTKVTITMTLQKKGFLGFWWSDETSWTQTFHNYNATMNRKHSVSSGTYRIKAVYTAYGGSASETLTEYSGTIDC